MERAAYAGCFHELEESKNMYAIGDKIVYPMHGTGYIEKIETRNIGGKNIDYYVIHILNGNIKLCLPTCSKSDIQLRPIASPEQAKAVLKKFEEQEIDPNLTWNKRYQKNMERLKLGDLENVAQVVKELMVRDISHGLSTGDRKMLILARGIFVKELSIILGIDENELTERLSDIIHQKLKS